MPYIMIGMALSSSHLGQSLTCPILSAHSDALLRRTNRVARRVLRPLGYLQLQLQVRDAASAAGSGAVVHDRCCHQGCVCDYTLHAPLHPYS